jgi:uncharacterized membrane protein
MRSSRSLLLVWLLLVAYGIYFSAFSIQRHRAFLTHASDLGQIDQAVWNTLHGRLLGYTKATGDQNIRLSDHVEPIFIPLSLVFLVYDNVEALRIVQSFAIAIGALAVFWIAHKRLAASGASPLIAEWTAVGFAAIYLLFPALEAANLAEFHAVTLAPAPLLFAYHYGTEKAWGRYLLFSILALMVKEEIALLVLAMALWFWVETIITRRPTIEGWLQSPILRLYSGQTIDRRRSNSLMPNLQLLTSNPQPLVLAVLALVWFVIAVFVVIPHFNALGRSPYTCRYVVSEDCPEIARGLFLDARLGYLGQLLASVGWIALLDPVSLLLGLPLIALNVVSNYPAQYSGTFHYSAPVAPYFVLAAIGGSARIAGWIEAGRNGGRESISQRLRVPRLRFSLASSFLSFSSRSPTTSSRVPPLSAARSIGRGSPRTINCLRASPRRFPLRRVFPRPLR